MRSQFPTVGERLEGQRTRLAIGIHSRGFDLLDVSLLSMPDGPVAVATISGFTSPSSQRIADIEQLMRKKLEDPALNLVIRFIRTDLRNRNGPIYLEWSGMQTLSREHKLAAEKAQQIIQLEIDENPHVFLITINFTANDDLLGIFLELTGTTFISQEVVAELEQRVSQAISRPVSIHAWFRSEAVISASGYQSYEDASQQAYEKQEPQLKKEIQLILQRSRM